jgi:hypothetical protein
MADAGVPEVLPNGNLLWIGADDRGVELEVIAFIDADDLDTVVVKHVMPYAFRRGKDDRED